MSAQHELVQVAQPLDLVALVLSGASFVGSVVAVVRVAPVFELMFKDFRGELPAFTELCLSRWFPLTLGLVPLAVAFGAILFAVTGKARLLLQVAAMVLSFLLPGVWLVGMYLPIFAVAGSIH